MSLREADALRHHRDELDSDRSLFRADYQANDLVFCRPEGGYYSPERAGARIVELMKKAGLEGVSLHSLRHPHPSELLSAGVPIPTVAKRLGHANANITLYLYPHALEADELAAAKIWDDAVATVIGANKRQTNRNLAKSGAGKVRNWKLLKRAVIEKAG